MFKKPSQLSNITKNNRVIVRIWPERECISIEIEEHDKNINFCINPGIAPLTDKIKQSPQIEICLYGLDKYMIENEFYKLKKDDIKGWKIDGNNLFQQNLENVTKNPSKDNISIGMKVLELFTTNKSQEINAAYLALKLLRAGGFPKAPDQSNNTNTLESSSFNEFIRALYGVKLKELKNYPATDPRNKELFDKQFEFPKETPITDLKEMQPNIKILPK